MSNQYLIKIFEKKAMMNGLLKSLVKRVEEEAPQLKDLRFKFLAADARRVANKSGMEGGPAKKGLTPLEKDKLWNEAVKKSRGG